MSKLLFFKAQRQAEPKATAAPAAELLRDLEMAAAIVNRATRRLAGAAAAEMDGQPRGARSNAWKTNFAVWPGESHRSKSRMLSQAQRTTILELSAPESEPTRDRADVGNLPSDGILELFSACKENLVRVHEELTAEGAALSYAALTAFCRKQGIGKR